MSRTKKKEGAVRGKTTNRIINILLVLGCLTILFPLYMTCLLYTSPSPRDGATSRMPSSA